MEEGINKNMIDISKDNVDASSYQPLILAYMGDAVYEVYIREMLIKRKKVSVHKLHVLSIKYVKASEQSFILHELLEELAQDELEVVKRGRNAKSATIPKNAKVSDYRYATGFEALIGYLYLNNNKDRLEEIVERAIDIVDKKMLKDVEKS
ncbi:MAG: Mini-ribonuclease 3 [Clostridiales bacterium]|nr:Mini-ribonuclease 3 [Clostridiales bacterium]